MRKKSEERRQAIIDIAATTFNELGFEGASMSEISARLGGSKATLYNYFASKEEIFVEVMLQQVGQHYETAFISLIESDDLRAALQRFGVLYLTAVLRPEVVAVKRLAYYYAERSNLGPMLYESGPKVGWAYLSEFLQDAMDKKQLCKADPWVAALQLRALLEAEWVDIRMLGVITSAAPARIRDSVERAIDAFMRVYKR